MSCNRGWRGYAEANRSLGGYPVKFRCDPAIRRHRRKSPGGIPRKNPDLSMFAVIAKGKAPPQITPKAMAVVLEIRATRRRFEKENDR